ncbi:MAG TPA: hypothetical protein DD412_06695 [Holosporales bacterium]|nr:hypothetical protein [Holosporales bacterium]
MVFKNKNTFTLALSLIIAPTSLIQASGFEMLEITRSGPTFILTEENNRRLFDIMKPFENLEERPREFNIPEPIIIPSPVITMPVAGEPTTPKNKGLPEIVEFLVHPNSLAQSVAAMLEAIEGGNEEEE